MDTTKNNSITVSYIGDLAHRLPDDIILVERDRDYVQVCQKLSHQFGQDDSVNIWVRSINHYAWLQDFTEQIDLPCRFEKKTARLVLAEQWNVSIPEWLKDAAVLEHNLLEIKLEPYDQMSFSNRLLMHLLGNVFDSDELSVLNLSGIVNAIVSDNAKAVFKKYPILDRCFEDKCREWAQNSSKAWVKEICNQFDVNKSVAETDTLNFLSELINRDIILIKPK